jgi:hypothetical protein
MMRYKTNKKKSIPNRVVTKTKSFFQTLSSWSGLIFASLPFVFYIFHYSYISGYFTANNIPLSFISFDLVSLASSLTVVLPALVVYIIAAFILYQLLSIGLSRSSPFLGFPLAFIILTSLLVLIFSFLIDGFFPLQQYLVSMAIVEVIFGFGFIFLLDYITERNTGVSKITNFIPNAGFLIEEYHQITKHKDNVIFKLIAIIIMIALGYFTLSFWGLISGYSVKEFFTANTTPECLVRYINTEIIICSPLDRTARKIDNSIFFVKIGEDNKLRLKKESLESIFPSPSPSPTPTITPTPNPTNTITPILTLPSSTSTPP